jgi:hypothetical protein
MTDNLDHPDPFCNACGMEHPAGDCEPRSQQRSCLGGRLRRVARSTALP